jgi:hypothetical protein
MKGKSGEQQMISHPSKYARRATSPTPDHLSRRSSASPLDVINPNASNVNIPTTSSSQLLVASHPQLLAASQSQLRASSTPRNLASAHPRNLASHRYTAPLLLLFNPTPRPVRGTVRATISSRGPRATIHLPRLAVALRVSSAVHSSCVQLIHSLARAFFKSGTSLVRLVCSFARLVRSPARQSIRS